ncbi:MAG: formylglycine-generating enzyme family protein [Chloroflexia bacterium]|nr:formylglycine-generating enzyme family protein [Chloroflexia bacterium]
MSEKRTLCLAAWFFIVMLIVASCQSPDETAVSRPIHEMDVASPTLTMSPTDTASPPPTPSQTPRPTGTEPIPTETPPPQDPSPIPTSTPQATTIAEPDDWNAVLEPAFRAADCLAADLPGIACTGVSTNDEWVPVIREFGGIPMALVPAGCFTMGSTDEQIEQYLTMLDRPGLYQDEQPAHRQCFQEPFWIDVYEVTNGFYGSHGWWTDNDQPRESVTWFEANTYCDNRGGHLPTEIEWEYAARGPDNLLYPWGNTFDGNRLNYCDYNCQNPGSDRSHNDGYSEPAPVGTYPDGASWVGALDMAGNLWEWVSTMLMPYPYRPDDGREVSAEQLGITSKMMVRGGGRLDPNYVVRSANRNERMAHHYDGRFGLRCARPFDPERDGEVPAQARPELVMAPPNDAGLGDSWTRPSDGAVMLFVPGGTFQMGTGTAGAAVAGWNELPEHPVKVDSFWIDKYHVTNKQYAEFLSLRGNQQESGVTWLEIDSEFCLIIQNGEYFYSKMGFEDHPVMDVSWYGARAYCEWIGGRLLTEAEWEYAASGPDNWIYPWGNEYDCTMGNFHDWTDEDDPVPFPGERGCDGIDFTSPVDAYPQGASWVGALDLAGNVWDWVADWGVYFYPSDLQVNPTGPTSGTSKIVRGGSWNNHDWGVRTTMRGDYRPSIRSAYIGFRCAYPAEP